jgi:hypothetical protein
MSFTGFDWLRLRGRQRDGPGQRMIRTGLMATNSLQVVCEPDG